MTGSVLVAAAACPKLVRAETSAATVPLTPHPNCFAAAPSPLTHLLPAVSPRMESEPVLPWRHEMTVAAVVCFPLRGRRYVADWEGIKIGQ